MFGAWSIAASDLLDRLGEIREGRLDKEFHDASWAERSFHNYYAARISIALHMGMAIMIRQGARIVTHRATHVDDVRRVTGRRFWQKQRRATAD